MSYFVRRTSNVATMQNVKQGTAQETWTLAQSANHFTLHVNRAYNIQRYVRQIKLSTTSCESLRIR